MVTSMQDRLRRLTSSLLLCWKDSRQGQQLHVTRPAARNDDFIDQTHPKSSLEPREEETPGDTMH